MFTLHQLEEKLNKPLKGMASQLLMAPKHRLAEMEDAKNKIKHARYSGVMILFFVNDNEELCIVFIRRSDYVGIHAGQMGLPGGRYEEKDENTLQTALRETFEEIGIEPEKIKVIGRLTGLYIPPSNFHVDPYIGFLAEKPDYKIDTREVKNVVELKLSDFFSANAIQWKDFKTHGSEKLTSAPFYKIGETEIWGATAMIISELLDMLKQP